jgi:predicted transcriptional regulator
MDVLLSINPKYVEEIRKGNKLFEYRKTRFRRPVSKVVVYSTVPCGKIVGEFQIKRIVADTPESVWDHTAHFAGITHKFFSEYFNGRQIAYAIEIEDYREYAYPCSIQEMYPAVKMAPQSFVYV